MKKKVALLTMRYDNNYGGNLQRYALYTVLQQLGCEVICLYIRDSWKEAWKETISPAKQFIKICKQIIKHILRPKTFPRFPWEKENSLYVQATKITEPFFEKYIKHTKICYSTKDLEKNVYKHKCEAIVIGSDQVWRKAYVLRYGLCTFFGGFIHYKQKIDRIVYGASFGVYDQEYTTVEAQEIQRVYKKLDAVSVREKSGMDLCNEYGWTTPKATVVLDPTLLHSRSVYDNLIAATQTKSLTKNKLWCYVLDVTSEHKNKIEEIAETRHIDIVFSSIEVGATDTIEQWLRNIKEADFIYTDSYHGVLFSIIYNKPFFLAANRQRGLSRFDHILNLFHITDTENINWIEVNEILKKEQQKSLFFLRNAINN